MIIHRRSFLTGLSSLIAAPAIVRASSLMPVKSFRVERISLLNWDQELLNQIRKFYPQQIANQLVSVQPIHEMLPDMYNEFTVTLKAVYGEPL